MVATAIGLPCGRQAHAQGPGSGAALVIGIASLADDEITDLCSRKFIANSAAWNVCIATAFDMRDKLTNVLQNGSKDQPRQLPSRPAAKGRAAASVRSTPATTSAFAPTFESSTPTLPFLGNSLTALNWVPDSTTQADVTVAYAIALARQSDCSLDEGYVLPGAGLPQAEYLTSLTEAQDYFHQVAALTTTPDVFANGCADQVLGLHASNTGQSLGQTSTGAAITAQLASAGLYVTVTDLTANTSKSTQVTSGSNPGAFYAASLRSNGIMDLVETGLTDPANSSPATAVLLGNGDGTFQKPVYYDVSANSFATAAELRWKLPRPADRNGQLSIAAESKGARWD